MEPPQVVVLGGPNGAGKTTSATPVLPKRLRILQFVNADVIAQGLSGYAPETAAMQAGRVMLGRIHELAGQRQNFSFETTLSSRSFAPLLRRMKGEGYEVTVVYVWLRSADLSVRRVAERVQRGGHNIPEADVRRRYGRGLLNFADLYRPLANVWILCDNSDREICRVAEGRAESQIEIFEQSLYDGIQRSIEQERNER